MGKTVDIAKGRVLPLMSNQEIEIINRLFGEKKPKTVLEWGSGVSTTYFPQRVSSVEKWVSIEHNPKWYEYVKPRVCKKVELRLRNDLDYYSEAVRLGERYDLIIVDGKYRNECLVAARFLVAENGIVVLHDSGRKDYINAYHCFNVRKELCKGQLLKRDGYYRHRGLMCFSNR